MINLLSIKNPNEPSRGNWVDYRHEQNGVLIFNNRNRQQALIATPYIPILSLPSTYDRALFRKARSSVHTHWRTTSHIASQDCLLGATPVCITLFIYFTFKDQPSGSIGEQLVGLEDDASIIWISHPIPNQINTLSHMSSNLSSR